MLSRDLPTPWLWSSLPHLFILYIFVFVVIICIKLWLIFEFQTWVYPSSFGSNCLFFLMRSSTIE